MNKIFIDSIEPLKELMKSYGMNTDDWCISGEYAWIINGYDVSMRDNHIDFYVKESKLPWKIRDRIQTIPPKDSKELDSYCDFIEKHKIALHMVPLPKPGITENLIDKYAETKIISHQEVMVISPEGNMHDLETTLANYQISEFGDERLIRWKKYLQKIEKEAREKSDELIADKATHLLNKYFSGI